MKASGLIDVVFLLCLFVSALRGNQMASKKSHKGPLWAFFKFFVTDLEDKYFRARLWYILYRSESILLHLFASQQVWCMMHQLISEPNEELFKEFRASQNSECSAVALAGTIIALIAIASMALPFIGKVHWIARALWLFSLLSGLVTVLYACNQQMTTSRRLTLEKLWRWMNDDRSWCDGKPSQKNCGHPAEGASEIDDERETTKNGSEKDIGKLANQVHMSHDIEANNGTEKQDKTKMNETWMKRDEKENKNGGYRQSKKETNQDVRNHNIKANNQDGKKSECDEVFFVPDFFAVLIVSGPRILLHYSLNAYMIGLAVYLGLVWQDQLDTDASPGDSRNIFIFSMVSLILCYAIYYMSDIANRCKPSPWKKDFDTVKRLVKKDQTHCIGAKALELRKEGEIPSVPESSQGCRGCC